jgi:hypothetical protein
VVSEYPDYVTYEAEVNQFVQSDPEFSQRYARMFNADPVAAMELAFLKFGESRRKNVQPPAAPNAQEMVDASLPGERTGESRRAGEMGQSEVDEAYRKYQQSGTSQDAEAYAKLRLRQAIPDSFFRGTE